MAEPIRIGLLGAGWITRAHAHALLTLNHVTPLARPIRMTAPPSPERGEAMARDFGIDRFSTDWREVVDDPDVDVVAVLPETAHREATEAALAQGKPVLCEKPLGRDRFEAAAMLDAARRAGVQAATGFNYRYMPAMRLAREIVDSGRLGRCLQFRALYLQDHAAERPEPQAQRVAGHHRLLPHHRFPALPRE